MKNINPYTGKPTSTSVLEGYIDSSMLKHSSTSILSGYVDSSMLKRSSTLSHVSSQLKPLSVNSSSNPSHHTKTVISNDSNSGYLCSIKFAQDAEASYSYQEVTSKAKSIDEEIKIITNSILKIGEHRVNVFNAGNDLCKKMSQHYLHEAEYNNCAYQKSRDEWKAKGNLYFTSNIYDIMKEYNILPSWAEQYLTPLENNQEEEELMKVQIEELKEQLKLLSLEKEQKDNALAEKDNALAEKDNALAEKDNALAEKDNALAEKDEIILQLQIENHDLTEKLSVSEKNNTILQDKLDISETKVISLQEKVVDLKHHNEQLENDKVELREDKKMLIEDKKMIQEEKNLLLVDKKLFQDLNITKENELTELKHIHFDTEHCTIVGHCNNPNHDEI